MGKIIGIFAHEISSRVQSSLYQALHKKAMKQGYNLVVFSGNLIRTSIEDNLDETNNLFELAESLDFAALLIHAQSLGDIKTIRKVIDMGHRKDVPVFVYDCDGLDIRKEDNVNIISMDYKQGFAEGICHVIEHHGCRKIAMLAGTKDNKFSDDRIEVYKEQLVAHGIPVDESLIDYGDFWELPAKDAVNRLLDLHGNTLDAICCANDSMAIAATKVLEQRNLRVPEDILVTGFDGIEDGCYNVPAISTCEPLVETVPDYMFRTIDADCRSGEFLVPLRFEPKNSCGCSLQGESGDKYLLATMLENARQNSWQHSMISNMQLELMDSCNLIDIPNYMTGIISLYTGYSHLYVIREDMEYVADYTAPFKQMRVEMNLDFLPDKEIAPFDASEIVPGLPDILAQAEQDDIFVFRMIQSRQRKYGYNVLKAKYFDPNDMKSFGQFVESIANTMTSVLRNLNLEKANQKLSEMYERMSEIYIRDTMTGLYNRQGYYQELDHYIAREDLKDGYIQIYSIDMDGMKHINDNYGHQEGDYAIKAVARTIQECISQPCICARFGGDEFMATIFTESDEMPTAEHISKKLNGYLSRIINFAEKPYKVGVSVGRAAIKISEMVDIKDAEKLADDAMYTDKRKRKGQK